MLEVKTKLIPKCRTKCREIYFTFSEKDCRIIQQRVCVQREEKFGTIN